jgi:hypothetical protein
MAFLHDIAYQFFSYVFFSIVAHIFFKLSDYCVLCTVSVSIVHMDQVLTAALVLQLHTAGHCTPTQQWSLILLLKADQTG